MLLFTIFSILLIIIDVSLIIKANDDENIVMLSPVDIADLVLENRMKNNFLYMPTSNVMWAENNLKINDTDIEPTKVYEDVETLKTRKMWSRWSKWGECSVTCGNGNISRRRMCIAGRCAPGEFEEQRRPCSRISCLNVDASFFDDLHDID